MGPVAEPIYAVVALTALGGALRKLGRKVDVGRGVDAAMAVIDPGKADAPQCEHELRQGASDAEIRRTRGRGHAAPRRASGKAVAERLGQEGATVVAVDINGDGAAATAKAIGGKSFGHACDIGDPDSVAKLFATVDKQGGKLDVLVNDAAIVPFVTWDELTFEEWRRVMRVNLDGLFLMCRAGSDLMRKNGYGRIVNFSSQLDLRRHAQHGALRRLQGRRADLHPRAGDGARRLQDHGQLASAPA